MFELNSNTVVISNDFTSPASQRAIERFYRDITFTIQPSERDRGTIRVIRDTTVENECWHISVSDREIDISAADDLGVIYALLHISRRYLNIEPLWFWCDQEFSKKEFTKIENGHIYNRKNAYRFRGWFINDEVLFLGWKPEGNSTQQWEMAFEALLRLGGNLVIPGTDRTSRRYRSLASDMGLWITHHHAEPLGAEMFSRAYPDLCPSYDKYPDLYEKLWRDAVAAAKNEKVIWTVGFRGQGDVAFWNDDPFYDTDEKRAGQIRKIILAQMKIVKEYADDPVFAFNIYNEAASFYRKGLLDLPHDVIKIFADNGYGCMVSRREWDNDPRFVSLPVSEDREKKNGMYYHVSFYDLQAANHITMTGVSPAFIAHELKKAEEAGIRDTIILNVSNIKPHLMPLMLVADFWNSGKCDYIQSLHSFCSLWYKASGSRAERIYKAYTEAAIRYGIHEDNVAGDQYFAYPVRMFLTAWMKGEYGGCHDFDFSFKGTLDEQISHFSEQMNACNGRYSELDEEIRQCGNRLLDDNLGTHVAWYTHASRACIEFSSSYQAFRKKDYVSSFISAGRAADSYTQAVNALGAWERGKWKGFYSNEALTDTRNMVSLMKTLMEYIRIYGDGPYFYNWQRRFTYRKEDRNVVLITNYELHMDAYEMYSEWKSLECREK